MCECLSFSAPYVPEYVKSFWIKLKAWCPFTLRALKDLPERLPNWVSSWLMTQSHKQYEVYILFLQLKVLPYYIDQIVNIRWITEIVWLRQTFDCVDHNKLWKTLEEMGIPDHLTWLLYADQEAIVRTGHGTSDWFQIGKGVRQGCILSLCLFNLYAEYIMRDAGLEKHNLESRLPGEISITSDMQMTPPLWQKVKN